MKIRKRRRRAYASSGGSAGSITLFHQRIPKVKFDALSEVDRYCVLLLGHVHDELSWLQRIAYVASRSVTRGNSLQRSGNMMQVTFLTRLLLGKLFEFKQVMGKQNSSISQFIAKNFHPDDPKIGQAKVKELQDFYSKEEWIRVARNKHFLHYPNLEDVRETLNDPKIDWRLEIAHSKKSSNTFYPTSDVLANYAWFRLANPSHPLKGLGEALDTTRELALLTLSVLERSIINFVDSHLHPLSEHTVVKIPVKGTVHEMRLNYFVKV